MPRAVSALTEARHERIKKSLMLFGCVVASASVFCSEILYAPERCPIPVGDFDVSKYAESSRTMFRFDYENLLLLENLLRFPASVVTESQDRCPCI